MLALGELNLAIAKANGEAITCRYTGPGTESKLWQTRWLFLTGAQEVRWGLLRCGSRPNYLNVNLKRHRKSDQTVSQALGKCLRMEVMKLGRLEGRDHDPQGQN